MTDSVYLTLEDPPYSLRYGVPQRWLIRVRKSGTGTDPTLTADLYEDGAYISSPLPTTEISSETVLEGAWDAASLNGRGTGVEVELLSERGSEDASVEIASFFWIAKTLSEETTLVSSDLYLPWQVHQRVGASLGIQWDVLSFLVAPAIRTLDVRLPSRRFEVASSSRTLSR